MSTPSLSEALAEIMDSRLSLVHTALPGIVRSYNAATQTAVVQPAVKRLVATEEAGAFEVRKLPEVPDVPVAWPGGGDHYVHFTLQPGDSVLLVFAHMDPSIWQRTGEISQPADHREHHPAHAFAIPCVHPRTDVLPDVGVVSPKAAIGGTSDSAALASKVLAIFQAIAGAPTGDAIPGLVASAITANPMASAVLKIGS